MKYFVLLDYAQFLSCPINSFEYFLTKSSRSRKNIKKISMYTVCSQLSNKKSHLRYTCVKRIANERSGKPLCFDRTRTLQTSNFDNFIAIDWPWTESGPRKMGRRTLTRFFKLVRGHSSTTWTQFYPISTTYPLEWKIMNTFHATGYPSAKWQI